MRVRALVLLKVRDQRHMHVCSRFTQFWKNATVKATGRNVVV